MSESLAPSAAFARTPTAAGDRPSWSLDGRDWPLREHSAFMEAAGLRWHVQQYGQGPLVLLLHGTAAATHSWRELGPRLAATHRVVAIDLPGHGFTSAPETTQAFTQRGMARAVAALVSRLGVEPYALIGHSAGAALAAALCLEAGMKPVRLIALNGALSADHAFAGELFTGLARLASSGPVAQLFAWRATPARVDAVIRGTGSTLDARGIELYRRLFARRGHVSAAFALMSAWRQDSVLGDLAALPCPLHLIAARDDRAVPCAASLQLHRRLTRSRLDLVVGGGHLVHECEPEAIASLVLQALKPSNPHLPPQEATP